MRLRCKIIIKLLIMIFAFVSSVWGQNEMIQNKNGPINQQFSADSEIQESDYIYIQIPKSYIMPKLYRPDIQVIQIPPYLQPGYLPMQIDDKESLSEISHINKILYNILGKVYSKNDLDKVKIRVSKHAVNDKSPLATTKQLINELNQVVLELKSKVQEKKQ